MNNIGKLINLAIKDYNLELIDAELILGFVTKLPRIKIKISHEEPVSIEQITLFIELARNRAAGMPLAYIIGYKEFWTLNLSITPDVLIPRIDTEILVETVLDYFPKDNALVLDLGTGSGAIALAIASEKKRAQVLAVDLSMAALNLAQANAQRLHLKNVQFLCSDWFSDVQGKFDVIVANPPYIANKSAEIAPDVAQYEPAHALYAGEQGLDCLIKIIEQAPKFLNAGGLLALEHGFDQAPAVVELLHQAGFSEVITVNDLSNWPRVSAGFLT